MTRRELRILRARAEAAGQPAPDVIFLPNGETTVTGAIPILDGDAFRADPTPQAPVEEPVADAAGVITEEPVEVVQPDEEPTLAAEEILEPEPEPEPEPESVFEQSTIDEQPIEVVVLERPGEPEIPALVEPEPDGTSRFPTDAPVELPAEIVVEPIDVESDPGSHTDPTAPDPDTSSTATSDSDAPAPGTLRPFDALFLPPSLLGTEGATDATALDTSSAQLPNDSTGLRGDILSGSAKPFGHWSTQGDDEDESDTSLSRDVSAGAGAVTTHALVLPSIPDSSEPLLSPLTSTGEIMVTGTIDLPRSYGSTGAHPALFDHPDVDALIDDTDRDDTDSGVAPVRATRAVSSTATTRSMIGAEPEKKSRLLPIVAISLGGAVFIAAVSWLVASLFFTQF